MCRGAWAWWHGNGCRTHCFAKGWGVELLAVGVQNHKPHVQAHLRSPRLKPVEYIGIVHAAYLACVGNGSAGRHAGRDGRHVSVKGSSSSGSFAVDGKPSDAFAVQVHAGLELLELGLLVIVTAIVVDIEDAVDLNTQVVDLLFDGDALRG